MTLDSLNAFTVTVALQSVLWKYIFESTVCKDKPKALKRDSIYSIDMLF